jgi:hypothetical protein
VDIAGTVVVNPSSQRVIELATAAGIELHEQPGLLRRIFH